MQRNTPELQRASRTSGLALFIAHQFVAMIGVIVAAPYVANFLRNFLSVFGWAGQKSQVSWILTETPYFPVQILLALSLGWLVGRHFRHRSMLWVWVLPFAALCAVVIAFPATGQLALSQYGNLSSASRFSHFFGWGCQPRNRCLDQVVITLPFYTAIAYSLGAVLARRVGSVDYIELLKTVDIRRTVLFVAVPCYCCELVSNFPDVRGQAFLRTGFGLFLYLGIALVETAVVTCLFVVLMGFVSRQLFPSGRERRSLQDQGTGLPATDPWDRRQDTPAVSSEAG